MATVEGAINEVIDNVLCMLLKTLLKIILFYFTVFAAFSTVVCLCPYP